MLKHKTSKIHQWEFAKILCRNSLAISLNHSCISNTFPTFVLTFYHFLVKFSLDFWRNSWEVIIISWAWFFWTFWANVMGSGKKLDIKQIKKLDKKNCKASYKLNWTEIVSCCWANFSLNCLVLPLLNPVYLILLLLFYVLAS